MLEGVLTALVTPFDAHGGLDLAAFRALCERQLAAGVHGLVPCGTTGETPTLEPGEWAALVSVAVEVAGGRVPVVAGVGTNSTRSTVARVSAARELGADAGLLVLPYYNKPNPAGHRAHLDAALAVGLPLVPYHVPGRTGQRLPVAQLAELCRRPGVVGVKEATGDLAYGSDLVALLEGSCPVLSGDDFTMLPLYAVGGAGVISVASNVDPAGTLAVWALHREGRVAAAAAAHHRLMPLVRWLFADTNPAPAKAALASLGLCRADTRLPLAPASPPPPGLLEGVVP